MQPVAKTAYDVLLPVAAEKLAAYFDGLGERVDETSAGCIDEPIEEFDEDGYTWFLCRAKPQ